MSFEKTNNTSEEYEPIAVTRGCVVCGWDPLFGGGYVQSDGGASAAGSNS